MERGTWAIIGMHKSLAVKGAGYNIVFNRFYAMVFLGRLGTVWYPIYTKMGNKIFQE